MADVKKIEPNINLFGGSNTQDFAFLNPYTSQDEPFQVVSNFSSVMVNGINGKGKEGKENPLHLHNLGSEVNEVGQEIIVINKNTTAKRVSFTDIEDPSLTHIIYFDQRRKKPMGYFQEEVVEGKKKNTRKMDINTPIFIKEPTISRNEFAGAFNIIASAVNLGNIDFSSGFLEASEKANKDFSKSDNISAYIALFDRYFIPTDENMRAIKEVLVDSEEKYPTPSLKAFKDGISSRFSRLEYVGIPVLSDAAATAMANLLASDKESDDVVGKEIQDYLKSKEGFKIAVKVEEDIITGIDATGSIVILENSNLPRVKGGYITSELIADKLKSSKDAMRILKRKKDEFSGRVQHVPSDNSVIESENILKMEAKSLASEYDEAHGKNSKEREKIESIINGMKGISGRLLSQKKENKDDEKNSGFAISDAQGIAKYISNLHIQNFYENSELLDNGMMVKGNDRIKQQFYSNHKKTNPMQRWGLDMEKVLTASLQATLPMLSFPPGDEKDGAIANFKNLKASVIEFYIDKEKKEIVGVDSRNDIQYWKKSHGRFGLILSAIKNLDRADENMGSKLKNLVNFGGKINDTASEFGLLAYKKSNEKVAEVYGGLIDELRGMVYDDGVDFNSMTVKDIQDRIAGLIESSNRNEKQLGLYISSVEANKERDNLLTQSFFIAASKSNSLLLVDYLGGKTSSLDGLKAISVKKIKDASVLLSETLNRLSPLIDEVVKPDTDRNADNIVMVARRIGWNISNSQSLKSIAETPNNMFIQKPSTTHNKFIVPASKYGDGKSIFLLDSLSKLSTPEPMDLKEKLADNLTEYKKNKPSYNPIAETLNPTTSEDEDFGNMDIVSLDMTRVEGTITEEVKEEKPKITLLTEIPEQDIDPISDEEIEEIIESNEADDEMYSDIDIDDMTQLTVADMEDEGEDRDISKAAKIMEKKASINSPAPVFNFDE